ncbi:hypothetical protein DAPPUDRAFT_320337 [Daphnia pulex]|uniref:Uncharacterized protein n=1 Tax=Daphnia pulex TaxID=6669 RepID=E9GPK2_DAPPU|nr:hypothetical protein DAPPUDRAFT_320337 [Daphnia pulex]|eukprot:EFX78653.1 hypothetical protein DAPPUDRAFT_320337 [Daphnia pulex]
MTTDSTSVPHDSEGSMDVSHCSDPGCYSKAVTYNASLRQSYDCFYAPFELDGIAFSCWNDKDGNDKFFWAVANTDVHT